MATTKTHRGAPASSGRKQNKTKGQTDKTSSKTPGHKPTGRKWSADVTKHSDAMDLKKGVFTSDDPKQIARSVEKSAAKSDRKKGSTEQSAMSMLNFYINRAGKNLPETKKKTLNKAKTVLKEKAGSSTETKSPVKKKSTRVKSEITPKKKSTAGKKS